MCRNTDGGGDDGSAKKLPASAEGDNDNLYYGETNRDQDDTLPHVLKWMEQVPPHATGGNGQATNAEQASSQARRRRGRLIGFRPPPKHSRNGGFTSPRSYGGKPRVNRNRAGQISSPGFASPRSLPGNRPRPKRPAGYDGRARPPPFGYRSNPTSPQYPSVRKGTAGSGPGLPRSRSFPGERDGRRVDSSGQYIETRKLKKMQTEASIKLQSVVRRRIAQKAYKKLLAKKDLEDYENYREEVKDMQRRELQTLQERIDEVERQKNSELRQMRDSFEGAKARLREQARRKLEARVGRPKKELNRFEKETEAQNQAEIARLLIESEDLKQLKGELEEMNAEMLKENLKLQDMNDKARETFKSLDAFAKKKTEEKMLLAGAIQNIVTVMAPQTNLEIKAADMAREIETRLKDVNRAVIYRAALGVQGSDMYDQLLYEDVMECIEQCETFLGQEVLPLHDTWEDDTPWDVPQTLEMPCNDSGNFSYDQTWSNADVEHGGQLDVSTLSGLNYAAVSQWTKDGS